jgi:diaminohydroxyphosphoribosylaminopyrimidine deaminase / 5-amino-6-(5-phosphoribosylamino)uracil reductase
LSGPLNARFMVAALALSSRARALSSPNPNVGCIIEKDGRVIGRGWTQPGGRPHAEAMALAEAGDAARGATAWVTLEPCAHESERGPACADSLIAAGIARVAVAIVDLDPRTSGKGIARLEAAGVTVDMLDQAALYARREMAGWWSRVRRGRPHVTLKLATSLDGCVALQSGESKWITGDAARAHGHLERARSNMILVGRGTFDADAPRLDVRLPGLEERSPRRGMLTNGDAPKGWEAIASPEAVGNLEGVDWLLVEGGAQTAAAFLKARLVDRLLLYRAPITIGAGLASLGDIGLDSLGDAHAMWHQIDTRQLGSDTLDVYERTQKEG